jgi:hypothetical protein
MSRLSLMVICVFVASQLVGQVYNDSTFRYNYTVQPPVKARPVLIDAYHNTIFNEQRNRPAACEAMLDILSNELGEPVFLNEPLSLPQLRKYPESLLIIKGLPNEQGVINDTAFYWKSPLLEQEVEAVVKWLYEGGQVMLFLSHFPNGSGGKPLLEALSVRFRDGYVYHGDHPGQSEDSQCSWFTMSEENGMIRPEHPVLKDADEEVEQIRLLCGAALFRNPSDVVLAYPDKSANLSLDTEGGAISFAEQSGQYAALLAFEFGAGKVIVSGDLGLFRNNVLIDEHGDKTYITINHPEADNAALLVNLIRWLKK